MKAFCVTTPDYEEMADECRRRAMEHGGITDFRIFHANDKSACHMKKLAAWLTYGEPVWMLDADWWMIRDCRLPSIHGELILGAPNNNPVTLTNMDTSMAICSCAVQMDMWNATCRQVIHDAMRAQREAFKDGDMKADEKFLNEAAFQSIPMARLSTQWNWCGENAPTGTIAIHAAGNREKLEWLKSQCVT